MCTYLYFTVLSIYLIYLPTCMIKYNTFFEMVPRTQIWVVSYINCFLIFGLTFVLLISKHNA